MQTPRIVLADSSRARLEQRFGASVAAWCDGLDSLFEAVASRWCLRPVCALPAGGTSVVLLCETDDHDRAVLKLTPDWRIAADEAAALRAWMGVRHAVTLLDADVERGALLLEWLPAAERLSDVSWSLEEVVPLLADLRLLRPLRLTGLPDLAERVEFVFDLTENRVHGLQGENVLRDALVDSRAAARALAIEGPVGLVHGDLHPGNVLRAGAGRGLVAIDPRPCLGDQAFDLVDWVLTGAADEAAVQQRIDQLSERLAGVAEARLWAWCRAMAVVLAISVMRSRPDDPWGQFLLRLADDA